MKKSKIVWRIILGLFFVGSGVNHLLQPSFYQLAMPPYLPWSEQLIWISGVLAIFLGLLLLVRKYSQLAAWGLIAWLIAVFPANVHMLANAYKTPEFSVPLLWLRLPLQFLLILWVFLYTKPEKR